jgi:trehalose-6-phosphate synthase
MAPAERQASPVRKIHFALGPSARASTLGPISFIFKIHKVFILGAEATCNQKLFNKGVRMKSRTFKTGRWTYKAYMKPVGHGYEVGVTQAGKPVFVGNFIKPTEAKAWYTKMTKELNTFGKKYAGPVPPVSAHTFYNRFITNTLYKHYYTFVNTCLPKNAKTYGKQWHQDMKKYKQMNTRWA